MIIMINKKRKDNALNIKSTKFTISNFDKSSTLLKNVQLLMNNKTLD